MAVAPAVSITQRQIERGEMRKNTGREATTVAMGPRRKATLGELIAAVTEEVARLTPGAANTNILVSQIIRHLFATHRVRLRKGGVLKLP